MSLPIKAIIDAAKSPKARAVMGALGMAAAAYKEGAATSDSERRNAATRGRFAAKKFGEALGQLK